MKRWDSLLIGARSMAMFGFVVFAVGMVYSNTFSVPLLLDDAVTIEANPSIRHLWPLWPILNPPPQIYSAGRPFYNLSYALNYAVGGTAVGGYHVVNLFIHIGAALALWWTVWQTLRLPLLRPRFGVVAEVLALFVALLWAVHPIQTEAVTYISQRAESLMGLCYLIALGSFVRGATSERPAKWFCFSVASCVLGMASKEVMVTVPIIILLFDRMFLSNSWREVWRRRRGVHTALISTWLLLGFLMVSSSIALRDVGTDGRLAWHTYVLTEFQVVVSYLKLSIWPQPLVFYYGPELYRESDEVLRIIGCASLLTVLIGASIALWLRGRALGLLGLGFFLLLAPTSSIVPLAQQPMAESRVYLPLIAVVAATVIGVFELAGPRVFPVLVAAVLGTGVVAHIRNDDYRSDLAIWRDTAAKRPGSARVHSIFAATLANYPGRQLEAITHLETALRIDPSYAEAHNNLANYLSAIPERKLEGLSHYERALRLKPDFADAHTNLGIMLTTIPGRDLEALNHFQEAALLDPNDPEKHFLVAKMLGRIRGREADSVFEYEQAIRLRPDYAEAHINLSVALGLMAGRQAEALVHCEQAVRINPEIAAAQFNLANGLAQIPGREAEALIHYLHAVRLSPNLVAMHYGLALFYARIGRLNDSVAEMKLVLKIAPGDEAAKGAIEKLEESLAHAAR